MPDRQRRCVRSLAFACLLTAFAGQAAADEWDAPASYYAGVSGTGSALKTSLYNAMRSGHTQRTYGQFRTSAILHDQDPANSSRILLVYNRASVSGNWDSGSTWNREHVWPDSRQPGSASNSTRGMQGDPHCLRPCNPGVNGSRSNHPFGYASSSGGYLRTGSVWFPGDSDKGDVARILFYADTRWGPEKGVSLVNGVFPTGNQMGDLASCIAWHYLDPPDTFERRRNHVIYSSAYNPFYFTNNRNAYIDLPGLLWSVYMNQANDSRLTLAGAIVNADGSSTLELGVEAIVGHGPSPFTATILKSGDDGTYYSVESAGPVSTNREGGHNAFPIITQGADSVDLAVTIDPSAFAAPGADSALIVIDNLDVTLQGASDEGGRDGDDLIEITTLALDHADGSFQPGSDADATTADFGAIGVGAGEQRLTVTIHNLEATPGFTAGLDVALGSIGGQADGLSVDPAALAGVPAGGSADLELVIETDAEREIDATVTLTTGDDAGVLGASPGDPLTIRVLASIVADPCVYDPNGDGVIDVLDLLRLLAAVKSNSPAGDINGDEQIDFMDVMAFLTSYAVGCP